MKAAVVSATFLAKAKRCAVGCSTGGKYNHSIYPTVYGIPEHLARLEDSIFEGMPYDSDEYKRWPRAFTTAIKPGADLSLVWPRFAVWLLTPGDGIPKTLPDAVSKACADVKALYARRIAGDEPTGDEWVKAAEAAGAAWAAGTAARALARVDREARTEERRNAAAYLLSKSDVVPDGSGNWPPLAEAAHAIVNGEHAKDAAYGSLTPEIYARVDGFADARRALAKLSGLSMKKEKRR